MDDLNLIKPHLTRLKLTGLLDNLDHRLRQAREHSWSYSRFLSVIVTDETQRRENKKLSRRLIKSGLEPAKTFEGFDFNFNQKIPELGFRELATCQFMNQAENLFLLGPSGVGKSHLAQALGHEAVRLGHEVRFERTTSLMKWLWSGHGDGTHQRRLRDICRCPLLILDDFGLEPLSLDQQSDLYEIICQRYEKHSLIITSNRDFDEWPAIFDNPLLGSAAMDRLVHRASKFELEGKSYRVEGFSKRQQRHDHESQDPS